MKLRHESQAKLADSLNNTSTKSQDLQAEQTKLYLAAMAENCDVLLKNKSSQPPSLATNNRGEPTLRDFASSE
jgi:hypothetical protein